MGGRRRGPVDRSYVEFQKICGVVLKHRLINIHLLWDW